MLTSLLIEVVANFLLGVVLIATIFAAIHNCCRTSI